MKMKIILPLLMILLIPSVLSISYSYTDTALYEGPVTADHPFAKAYEMEVTFYAYTEFQDNTIFNTIFDQVEGNPAPPLFTSIFTCANPSSATCYNSVFKGQNPAETSFFIEMTVSDDSNIEIRKETYFNGASNTTTIADLTRSISNTQRHEYIDFVRFPISYPTVSFNRVTYKLYKDMSPFDDTSFLFGAGQFAGIKVHAPTSDDGAVCKYLKKDLIVQRTEKVQNITSRADRIYKMSYDIFDVNLQLFQIIFQIIKIGLFIVALGAFIYVVLFIVKIIKGDRQ